MVLQTDGFQKETTQRVIACLKNHLIPWRTVVNSKQQFIINETKYLGINRLLLSVSMLETCHIVKELNEVINFKAAEKVASSTTAKIIFGGNQPCYIRPVGDWPNHTGGDYIRMPYIKQFTDQSEYYVTLFHELCHWSEVRLNWTGECELGELVAEIGGCYLAIETGIPNLSTTNHNKYLDSWIKFMENDPEWVFQAVTQANKTVDHILSYSKKNE